MINKPLTHFSLYQVFQIRCVSSFTFKCSVARVAMALVLDSPAPSVSKLDILTREILLEWASPALHHPSHSQCSKPRK